MKRIFFLIAAIFCLAGTVSSEERAVSKENRFYNRDIFQIPFLGAEEIITDADVTSSNDSLESAWKNITGAMDVELAIYTDDTMHIKYYVDYSFGTFPYEEGTGYLTLAVDSIKTVGTANTGLYKGVLLRGYGTSGIVNQIPGANMIRWRGYRQSGSEATGAVRVGLLTA